MPVSSALVLLVALTLLATPVTAQKKKHCTGTAPDSTVQLVPPVYRDCDVDQPAKVQGEEPRPDLQSLANRPRSGCMRVELEFIVDSLGKPELATVQPKPGNDRDLQDAVLMTLGALRYTPARLAGQAVRQIVVYKVSVGMVTRVVSTRPGSIPEPNRPPPRC